MDGTRYRLDGHQSRIVRVWDDMANKQSSDSAMRNIERDDARCQESSCLPQEAAYDQSCSVWREVW